MYTENGSVDNGGEDEEVEYLAACLPNRGVAVFCLALLIETIDLCDLARLMVASN